MALQILAVLGSLLTLLIGIWKWVKRMKHHERLMANQAKEKWENAKKPGNTNSESDLLDAAGKLRMR